MPSKLKSITKTKQPRPPRILIYGPEKVGKTTLVSQHPDECLFLDIERGSGRVSANRCPLSATPTFDEVIEALTDIRTGEHSFGAVAIDTISALEPIIWRAVAEEQGQADTKSIHDIGYGRGYALAADKWRMLLAHLERLRDARGMSVILVGHSNIERFANPEGEDYDRYSLKVHKSIRQDINSWCDVIGFCNFEELASTKVAKDDRPRGVSTGGRYIHWERTAAYDAGNRCGLPKRTQLTTDNPWSPIAAKLAGTADGKADAIIRGIERRLTVLEDVSTAKKVVKAVDDAAGDVSKLNKIITKLDTMIAGRA